MEIKTAVSTQRESDKAVKDCMAELGMTSNDVSWLMIFHTDGYDSTEIAEKIN